MLEVLVGGLVGATKQIIPIQVDVNGFVQTSAAASGGSSYLYIPAGAPATYVVKASAGTLYSITFDGPATATNVTTIYDNATTSGTVIDNPTLIALTMPLTIPYGGASGLAFANGLTIITTIANGCGMLVCFK